MPTILTRTLRAATRKPGDPLNVFSFATHERNQEMQARAGHHFYVPSGPGLKSWNTTFAPVPPNLTVLPDSRVPTDVPLDLVLSQTRTQQFPAADALSKALHCPHVTLEHVLPNPGWNDAQFREIAGRRGHLNVFISRYSRDAWGYDDSDSRVIEHGVDTDLFKPLPYAHRSAVCLSVVNAWKARDSECGYTFWKTATEGLPTLVVGDNPGLSEPAGTVEELAFRYQTSQVFVNTSLISPIPTTLLEAMSCGCCPVSTRNPMIDTVIRDGENGFLVNSPDEMRSILSYLLGHPDVALELGHAARSTVLRRFSLGRFVMDWQNAFEEAAGLWPTWT